MILQQNPRLFSFLEPLPQASLQLFYSKADQRIYSKADCIYNINDPANSFYLVCKGVVILESAGDNKGKTWIKSIVGPGEVFGLGVFFADQFLESARVRSKAAGILVLEKNFIHEFFRNHPACYAALSQVLLKTLAGVEEKYLEFRTAEVSERVKRLFEGLKRSQAGKMTKLTRIEIGKMVNASPQMVGQAIDRKK